MMFTDNKYRKTYCRIVDKAKSSGRKRTDDVYYENHHIVPKSMGGTNGKGNKVLLTAKEHFVCHWLLTKFTDGDDRQKMNAAFSRMTTPKGKRPIWSGLEYAAAKRANSSALSFFNTGRPVPNAQREKIASSLRGKPHTEERKAALRAAWVRRKAEGRIISEEGKARISEFHKNRVRSAESSKKISESLKGNTNCLGRVHSEETKRKMSESRRRVLAEKRMS